MAWTGGVYGHAWNPYYNTQINYAYECGPATSSSLVMAAVNWAGTALPEAPIQMLERNGANYEPIADHPLSGLMARPNPYMSGELLWKCFALSWLINGNVYFRKVRNAYDQVIEIWYECHDTIRPRWPEDGYEFISFYEVLRNGTWYRVEKRDVIHFRYGYDPENRRLGLSPLGSLMREIFTDNERGRYSALILRNGGVVPVLLTNETAGTDEIDAKEIKREFEYRTTGDNLGKPIVLAGAWKLQSVGASPEKLLVDKFSTIPEERIAAVLTIPAAVLGFGAGLQQTKVGATMRELREQAFESFVIPTYRIIDGELNVQLLSDFEDTSTHKISHDLAEVRVLQEDRTALYAREALAYEKGLKTRAEVRSALGLEADSEDDVYFIEPGLTTMEQTQEIVGTAPDGQAADTADPAKDKKQPSTTKAAANGAFVASEEEALDWLAAVLPKEAQGLEKAEAIQ